jgi:hypothetical protein
VPIIRRSNCDYATLGTWYSVWMTGMQGGMKTEASDLAVSAVLLQTVDRELAPISYCSCLLTIAARRYST